MKFDFNVKYGHGDSTFQAWIECKACNLRHGLVSNWGSSPSFQDEFKAWRIWDGIKEAKPGDTKLEDTYAFKETMKVLREALKAQQIRNEKIIMESIAKHADPPIIGELTEMKLKNRDIVLVKMGNRSYLTQRGKRISEDIFNYNNDTSAN